MSYISERQLRDFRRSNRLPNYTLRKSLDEYRNESPIHKIKIFLSHKHDELEQLEGAISFLKNLGVDIYVDWLDGGMPKITSGYTAERLKQKIKVCDKFILLATDRAIDSKWCNWELGLGDAAKYIEHIALFPIKRDYSDFTGNEYLQIYPYIFNVDNHLASINGKYYFSGTYVVFPTVNGADKVVPIAEWLRRK